MFLSPSVLKAEELAAQPGFRVDRIEVEGNSLLSKDELTAVIRPFEGRELSLEQLKSLALQLQDVYRCKGYFLAQALVPAQDVTDGVARIQVMEGTVGQITVEGNRHYSTAFILEGFAPAIERGALRRQDFQRALLLLNENPSLQVKAVLKPGKLEGSTDVVLQAVDRRPWEANVEYNNFGSRYTGQNRAGSGFTIGNLSGSGDVLNVRGVYAFPTSSRPFVQASYSYPLSPGGPRLTAAYASGDMQVGQELQIYDIRGSSDIYSLSAAYPVVRRLEHSADVSVAFVSKSNRNTLLSQTTSQDELRILALGYSGSWTGGQGRTILSLNFSQGLGSFLGGMKADDPLASRQGADDNFTKLDFEAARVMALGADHFLILRLTGQASTAPLVVGEQFALGGPDSVRGFPQSQFLGDSGYTASAELRIPVAAWESNRLAAAVFVDHGTVYLAQPQVGEASNTSLLGAGAGLRLVLGNGTWARLDAGVPLGFPGDIRPKTPMIYGQITTRFDI